MRCILCRQIAGWGFNAKMFFRRKSLKCFMLSLLLCMVWCVVYYLYDPKTVGCGVFGGASW